MTDYPRYQISLPAKYGMFTIRAEDWDDFYAAVETASNGKSQQVIDHLSNGFGELSGDTISTSSANFAPPNASPASVGFPTHPAEKLLHEEMNAAPLCPGHNVPYVLKERKDGTGKFWACNGMGPDGQPAWKSKTSCKIRSYNG